MMDAKRYPEALTNRIAPGELPGAFYIVV